MLIALYEPRRLSEEDFLAGFVARQQTASFLVDQLRHLSPRDEVRHRLLVGQRGMGKTSLLRRIAIAIARDDELSAHFVPLTFREEQYNVRHVDRFWRNCGEALAEWLELSGDLVTASHIDRHLDTEKWTEPGAALRAFISAVSSLKRRAVLLVDNVDLILDALPPDERWQLRRALQMRGGPILYGTSVHFPPQCVDQNEAFYEFFQVHQLEPLTENELLDCMQRLVAARGDPGKPVRDILERQPERLRVLHDLTGGNPRVLVLIYQLLERAESPSVFADLEALLDQMTPLYKARVEELKTELPRAIIDAIALNWDPITCNSLSKITGEPITTISSQLHRLRNEGLIEEVATSGSRAGYQIIERFFNIWYLMRHGTRRTRHRMRWLAAFLESFYSFDELRQMRNALGKISIPKWLPFYEEAIEDALDRLGKGIIPFVSYASDIKGILSQNLAEEEEKLRAIVTSNPNSTAAWIELAVFLARQSNHAEEARTAYLEAIKTDENNANAWRSFGMFLLQREEYNDAEHAYRRCTEIDPKDSSAWSTLGYILFHEMRRFEEAQAAFRQALSLNDQNEMGWLGYGLMQQELGDLTGAETALRRAVEVKPGHRLGWDALGELLTHGIGRFDQAEEVYRKALEVHPNDSDLWYDLGHLLAGHLKRFADSEPAHRRAIELNPHVAKYWISLSLTLQKLKRPEEAETLARRGLEVNHNYPYGWLVLAHALDELARYDEAESACRKAIELDSNYASAWKDLGLLLQHQLKRLSDAETAYRHALELDRNSESSFVFLANLLAFELQRGDEAEILFREALGVFPKSEKIWTFLGFLLQKGKRIDEAESAFRKAIDIAPHHLFGWLGLLFLLRDETERYDEAENVARRALEIHPNDAWLWAGLGQLLNTYHLSHYEEAELAFRRAIELEPTDARTWNFLGNVLQDHLGRFGEAEEMYSHALGMSSQHDSLTRANLFWLKLRLGKIEDAQMLYRDIDKNEVVGTELIKAALELARDNFGAMTEHLSLALRNPISRVHFDDLLRLLRLVKERGYGSRLREWLKQTEHDVTHAPIYAAFSAFVGEPKALLDFNPEVRQSATQIYRWLAGRDVKEHHERKKRKPRLRRGHRRNH